MNKDSLLKTIIAIASQNTFSMLLLLLYPLSEFLYFFNVNFSSLTLLLLVPKKLLLSSLFNYYNHGKLMMLRVYINTFKDKFKGVSS